MVRHGVEQGPALIGGIRNLASIVENRDLRLVTSYLGLRARQLAGRPPERAHVLDYRVAYADFDALVGLVEEIFLRRHYPFRSVRPRPLVVDAGANIGLATLFFKAVAPDARVLAFEPEPEAFRLLRENVERNGLRDVNCHQVALGAAAGEAELYVPSAAEGGSSLRFGADAWPATTVTVEPLSCRLDEPVDFLKLDVEGVELDVLEELHASGKLALVEQIGVEHHQTGPGDLPRLLGLLAEAGFRYRIAMVGDRFWDEQQLLLVHAFR